MNKLSGRVSQPRVASLCTEGRNEAAALRTSRRVCSLCKKTTSPVQKRFPVCTYTYTYVAYFVESVSVIVTFSERVCHTRVSSQDESTAAALRTSVPKRVLDLHTQKTHIQFRNSFLCVHDTYTCVVYFAERVSVIITFSDPSCE